MLKHFGFKLFLQVSSKFSFLLLFLSEQFIRLVKPSHLVGDELGVEAFGLVRALLTHHVLMKALLIDDVAAP